MGPTPPSDHWLNWFSDPSSSRPAPQRSTLTCPQYENSTPADSTTRRQPQHCQEESISNLETTPSPHYGILHRDRDRQPAQQQSTGRSRWRWSEWSAANPRRSKGKKQQRNPAGTSTERTPHNRHSWLDQHKRRTYPPRAMRVLKQEHRRLTQKGGKKSKMYRLIGASNSSHSSGNTDKKLRDAFFTPPVRRRRHSLTGVLTSFVHSSASLSPPSSSNTDQSGDSSSRFRRSELASHLSLQQTTSSSRKSKTTLTVRSSMVIQHDDQDNGETTSMHLVYRRKNDGSKSTLESFSSRRRQKQRARHQGSHHWFSNWIHHPRRSNPRHVSLVKALNNNGSSSSSGKIYPTTDKKKKDPLPLLRHATLSDLSSLSSSNPSHLLKSSNPPTLPSSSFRFSAFWKSSSGKSGKQVIHVDERGLAGRATLCRKWKSTNHDTLTRLLAALFLAGFLLCPLWWIGATLYFTKSNCLDTDLELVYLCTPRTFGHLNVWMSAVSLLLLVLLAALAIWYHLVV